MRRAFFIIGSLHLTYGGLTKALLLRANTLTELGVEVTLLSTDYWENMDDIVFRLHMLGKLHPAVRVRNFWSELVAKPLPTRPAPRRNTRDEDAVMIRTAKREDLFVDGLRVCRRTLNAAGKVASAEYFDHAGRRTHFETFWANGVKRRSMTYFADSKKLARESHFDTNGNCRISVEYNDNRTPILVHVWKNASGQTFPNLTEPLSQWVKSIVQSGNVVFGDRRPFDSILLALGPSIRKVAVAHVSHLREPFTDPLSVSGGYQNLFRDQDKFDLVAMLTPQQCRDAEIAGYSTTRLRVMPNLPAVPRPALAPKQKNYIVVCARYVPEKRLDDTIRALKIVAEANPDMRADFFGAGVEKQKLIALCRELGLSEVVKVNDFTASPLDAFATAQCTIMTSKHEGLPLTLQECLSVGTPTVAYDIRYGPAHLIEDGVTGYLVPDGDVAGVAQRVIEILANPDKAHAMAQAALNASHRFSEQAYRQAWQEALDEMFAGSEENDSQIKPSSWLARAKKYFAA